MVVSTQRLQHNFSRAAVAYDARAQFQHVQTRRVLDAALMLLPERARLVEVGCGTGYFASVAREKRPGWNILGIDISTGMCAVAATRCTAIAGDAARLPLADASVDAAVSSLCYQWVEDQAAAFAELARVMKPGARAIIASLGAATLRELRACAEVAQVPLSLLSMRALAQASADLRAAGFEITLADAHEETRYYPSVSALMDSMRSIGAGNNFKAGEAVFITPKRWAALVHDYEKLRMREGIPATWEHQFFIVHRPL